MKPRSIPTSKPPSTKWSGNWGRGSRSRKARGDAGGWRSNTIPPKTWTASTMRSWGKRKLQKKNLRPQMNADKQSNQQQARMLIRVYLRSFCGHLLVFGATTTLVVVRFPEARGGCRAMGPRKRAPPGPVWERARVWELWLQSAGFDGRPRW